MILPKVLSLSFRDRDPTLSEWVFCCLTMHQRKNILKLHSMRDISKRSKSRWTVSSFFLFHKNPAKNQDSPRVLEPRNTKERKIETGAQLHFAIRNIEIFNWKAPTFLLFNLQKIARRHRAILLITEQINVRWKRRFPAFFSLFLFMGNGLRWRFSYPAQTSRRISANTSVSAGSI